MIKYRKLKKEKNKPKYTQKIYRQKFCHELLNRYDIDNKGTYILDNEGKK